MSRDKLIIDSVLYLVARVVPAGLTLVSIGIFVRLFGTYTFGQYVLYNAIVLVAGNVGSTWLVQSVLRYKNQEGGAGVHVSDTGVWYASFLTALICGCLVGAVTWFRGESLYICLLVAGASMSVVIYSVASAVRQAELRVRSVLASEVARGLMLLMSPVVLYLLFGFDGFAVLMMGVALGNTLGLIMLLYGEVEWLAKNTSPDADRVGLVRYFRFGIPMMLWMISSVLINTADRFVIEARLGVDAVGLYSSIAEIVYKTSIVLMLPISQAAHPAITKAWNGGDMSEVKRVYLWAIRLTVLVAVSVLLVWAAVGEYSIRLLTGNVVDGAAVIILLSSLAAISWQTAVVVQKTVELKERPLRLFALALVLFLVQLALNWFLLPVYGIAVAAATMALSSLCYLISVVVWSWKDLLLLAVKSDEVQL